MTNRRELNDSDNFLFPSRSDSADDQALGQFLLDSDSSSQGAAAFEAAGHRPSSRYDLSQMRTESVQQRVAEVRVAAVPLLEACQPLLRALSEMPAKVEDTDQVWLLKESLKQEITLFNLVCDEVDISWKKMAIVRYCLCTALDEAAHGQPWGVAYGWSQSNLLNHFEGDNDGGNKFFLLVGRLSMTPHDFADVLEIQLRILALGFEGRYSIIENGERQLTKIRQRLLALLISTRDGSPASLSDQAVPPTTVRQRQRLFVPVRVSLLLAALLAGGLFISCKYWLMVPQSRYLDQLQALAKQPLPAVKQPRTELRLTVLLKPEIDQHLLSVDETAGQSRVTFSGDAMFDVAGTHLRPEMEPVLTRVAEEIVRVKGRVQIIGHSDTTPIHRPGLPNNRVLSEKRAASVGRLLQQSGLASAAIEVNGMGDSQPVANNATPVGRAKNRRVDLVVTY